MLELIVPDASSRHRGQCYVSISGKFSRMVLYKQAYELMVLYHGQDIDYVQFWSDNQRHDRFWIKPTAKEATGSTRIVLNPANGTKTISAAHLLKFLNWRSDRSIRCPLMWDTENKAAMVLTEQTEV